MSVSLKNLLASAALMLVATAPLPAAADASSTGGDRTGAVSGAVVQSDTVHQGVFNGLKISYRSSVEEFLLGPADGASTASVIVTSYRRTDLPSGRPRPVIFAFNGGPGSSSIWLHMGFLGPRRVDMDDSVAPRTTAPFRLVDNPDSPLDAADIVLIDPPGTGYSRILPKGRPEEYYGVDADARATVSVIRQWLRRHGRENSPKYMLSESYGTIRAAVVAKLLAGGPTGTGSMDGITLNGVMLIGQAMELPRFTPNDESVANILPTLAATACYYKKITENCTSAGQAEKARSFIRDRYLSALFEGASLPLAERTAIAGQLSALIGVSPEAMLANDLRISATTFASLLMSHDGRRLGMYDARYALPLSTNGGDTVADDPAMGQYVPAFVGVWGDYARDQLKVRIDRQYEPIAFGPISMRWDFGFGPGVMVGSRNYATDLAVAMTRNPHMRLMVGSGYYDLVTPLGLAEYTVAHAGIPLSRTQFRYYESGHMPYLGSESRKSLASDVRQFVSSLNEN
ncbi:MAG: peptidase S10 [Sphingobium sp.]